MTTYSEFRILWMILAGCQCSYVFWLDQSSPNDRLVFWTQLFWSIWMHPKATMFINSYSEFRKYIYKDIIKLQIHIQKITAKWQVEMKHEWWNILMELYLIFVSWFHGAVKLWNKNNLCMHIKRY